MDKDNL